MMKHDGAVMKLTPKRERFCQEMCKPEANQSKAYKTAFNPKRMSKKTINEAACRLMADSKIKARIEEIMRPVIAKVRVTQEQWLDKMESFFHADVRKMFVGPGQPVEIHELGDHEALLVEGYEVTENFAKVGDKAEHVGYTHKVKLTPGLKRHIEFGKVMGWYTEKKELSLDATLEELVLGSMTINEKENGEE